MAEYVDRPNILKATARRSLLLCLLIRRVVPGRFSDTQRLREAYAGPPDVILAATLIRPFSRQKDLDLHERDTLRRLFKRKVELVVERLRYCGDLRMASNLVSIPDPPDLPVSK